MEEALLSNKKGVKWFKIVHFVGIYIDNVSCIFNILIPLSIYKSVYFDIGLPFHSTTLVYAHVTIFLFKNILKYG